MIGALCHAGDGELRLEIDDALLEHVAGFTKLKVHSVHGLDARFGRRQLLEHIPVATNRSVALRFGGVEVGQMADDGSASLVALLFASGDSRSGLCDL